eukprot:4765625-Lingulodinium_polyedra.AAC.1
MQARRVRRAVGGPGRRPRWGRGGDVLAWSFGFATAPRAASTSHFSSRLGARIRALSSRS